MNVPQKIPFRSTLKSAARRVHRWRTVCHKKTMILVYHRVAEAQADPWGLNVSPLHFVQQLQVLQTIANPVSLRELIAANSDGDLPAKPVCITFDDGYADNLHHAKPALTATNIPGTVFVTPGYMNHAEDLWWDELAKIVLDPAARGDEVCLTLQGRDYACRFPLDDGASHVAWRAWEVAPGPREAAYLALYQMLVTLPESDREQALEQLRPFGRPYADRQRHRCLTDQELRELATGDLVEIGAHTLTHPALAALPAASSKRRLPAANGGWKR